MKNFIVGLAQGLFLCIHLQTKFIQEIFKKLSYEFQRLIIILYYFYSNYCWKKKQVLSSLYYSVQNLIYTVNKITSIFTTAIFTHWSI